MAGNTYKVVELVGTSAVGVSEAIEAAIVRAGQTLRGLDWFEVQQIRGTVRDGRVGEYQAVIKVGFRVLSDDELKA